jgi:hypothetical protein
MSARKRAYELYVLPAALTGQTREITGYGPAPPAWLKKVKLCLSHIVYQSA